MLKLYGFSVSNYYNMVKLALLEKGLPTTWDLKSGKNVKWVAELGSQSYGNPTVGNGVVLIGVISDATSLSTAFRIVPVAILISGLIWLWASRSPRRK